MNIASDKKQLYNRVVYVYFCFFSMLTADAFSMSVTYGAALFFSLSALFRMFSFSVKTTNDSGLLSYAKGFITAFFLLSTAYIVILYPFLFPYKHTLYAITIIILIFLEREAENLILRRHLKKGVLDKKGVAKIVIPVEAGFTILAGAIAATARTEDFLTVLAGTVIGMVFNFFRQFIYQDYLTEFRKPHDTAMKIRKIRSASLYYGMAITSGAALNIFAFTYILYIMLSGKHNFLFDFFIVFGGISLIFMAIYLGTGRAINSPLIQRIGKNTAFLFGTAISIFSVYVFRDSWFKGAFTISIQTVLLLIGLTLQMVATVGLKEDIMLVLKLYDPGLNEEALGESTARLEVWTAVISETVFLAVLIIIISNPLFYMMDVQDYIVYAPYVGSSVMAVPTVFLLISLVYSIKQPLTKKFGRRLKTYEDIKSRGLQNLDMEKRLENVLIKKYKKRIGVYIIKAFLKGIMFHTVTGREHVKELPGVFVFNHGELYGPIAAVVYLPYDIRPWILDKMIDKKEITEHIYTGTFSRIKWLPVFLRKLIAKALSPIIVWALKSFDPIPVFRGAARGVIKTFQLSVECLNSGDSILLFPENPEERYGDRVNSFYSGFADLGRMFYRKTEERLVFYPVYASRRSRILRIGEGVKYEPGNGREERDRIVAELEQRMLFLQKLDEIKNQ